MFIDDVIYVGLLLASVAFGAVFRGLKGPETKQWVSTTLGFGIACIVSGGHVAHPVVCTLINAVILTRGPWRKNHVVGFLFTFFYLLVVFRLGSTFGLPESPSHTNLIQMLLTLRLAGLGFEIDEAKRQAHNESSSSPSSSVKAMQNIKFLDVIHYGFSYMGLLTGPYYRYRTYWDCIHMPFAKYADCWKITEHKLKVIGVLIVLHLASGYLFPTNYILTEEFLHRSFFYRLWYVYPAFFTFRTRIYAGMSLSECVCQMAGLGAYPTSCETMSGHGPVNYAKAEALAADADNLKNEPIDFETVHNIDIYNVETSYRVRKTMKLWNMTVQYWMAAYVYKQFPHKALRTPATFLLSAIWHGYAIGYHICITSVTLYLPFEDIYMKFYNHSKEDSFIRKALYAMLFFVRFSCMSYLSIGFQLLTYENTSAYYTSVYFAGHAIVGILWAVGKVLLPHVIKRKEIEHEIKNESKDETKVQ